MDGDQASAASVPGNRPPSNPKTQSKWWLVIVIVVLLVVGLGAYLVISRNSRSGSGRGRSSTPETTGVSWQMMGDGSYQPSETPPDCATPLILAAPTDLSKVVSVLYPGQSRGGNYKPHGGFRFADGLNEVAVTAPLDASVVDASRYLVEGEIQYTFDFVNDCGVKYRLGHLRTLTPTFAALTDGLPPAKEMDSRTTEINPPMAVKQGDEIATAVGLLSAGNAFFDFGVYDLRQFNEASKDTSFQTAHADDQELSWHAVCWFDLLSTADATKVRSLPATSPGSQSDYCK